MTSFIVFTVVAIIAHILAWQWRPWLPGSEGYKTGMLDHIQAVGSHLVSLLT